MLIMLNITPCKSPFYFSRCKARNQRLFAQDFAWPPTAQVGATRPKSEQNFVIFYIAINYSD